MNEKIKISLIAASSFGLGAASMAGFLAWTFASTMKEMNKKPAPYRYRPSEKRESRSSSEDSK